MRASLFESRRSRFDIRARKRGYYRVLSIPVIEGVIKRRWDEKEAPDSLLSLCIQFRREPAAPHAAPFPQFQSSAPSAGLPLAQAQRARQSTEGQGCDWRVSVFIRSFFFLAALSFHLVFFTSRALKFSSRPRASREPVSARHATNGAGQQLTHRPRASGGQRRGAELPSSRGGVATK